MGKSDWGKSETTEDIFCPFSDNGVCNSGCGPTNRDRACVNGLEDE